MAFDDLDRRIVAALVDDARATYAEVGSVVGLSAPAVKRRVDRLRASGAITGFSAQVDPTALGWTTEAYVELFCRGRTSPGDIAAAVAKHPEVIDACTVTGEADALRAHQGRRRPPFRAGSRADRGRAVRRPDTQRNRLVQARAPARPAAARRRRLSKGPVRHGLSWISAEWRFWSVSWATVVAMTERHDDPAGNGRRMTTGEFRAAPDISASTAQFRAFAEDKSEAARGVGRGRAGPQPGQDRHPHRARGRGPRDHRDSRRHAGLAGAEPRHPVALICLPSRPVRDGMFVLAVMTVGPDTAVGGAATGWRAGAGRGTATS